MYASKSLAPYEYWAAKIQREITLNTIFLRPPRFDMHTDDSNPKLQSLTGTRVHQETYRRFWDNLPPNFIPTTVAQLYPHSSKVSDHLLNDEVLKRCNILAPQQHSYNELLFQAAQSIAFISKKQYRHIGHTTAQSVSHAQVTIPAYFFEITSEAETVNDQSTKLQKFLILSIKLKRKLNHTEVIFLNYLTLNF